MTHRTNEAWPLRLLREPFRAVHFVVGGGGQAEEHFIEFFYVRRFTHHGIHFMCGLAILFRDRPQPIGDDF